MSLNPDFASASSASAVASAPDAKFSLNINAFNGNTTNFGPKPKAAAPVQPRDAPVLYFGRRPGTIVPM